MGFGPSSYKHGRKYLKQGDYPKALEMLTDAVNLDPENPKIHRDLGIAYYKSGQHEQAVDELNLAKEKLERDGNVVFYLGMAHENLKQYDEAVEEYSNYTKLRRFSRMRKKIQKRIYWLARQAADQWVMERMEMEKMIDTNSIPDNTIAVTYFKPFGVSKELEPLHMGLTDLLIIDLSMIESLKVLERIILKEIYDELGLASTDVIDQATAPRMGKLLGANSVVTGTFTGLTEERWRVDPTLALIKLGVPQPLESVEGRIPGFMQVEKDLVIEILESLNIPYTQEEKEKILGNIPTESLQAFLAYSRGLDYLDNGMYNQAVTEFENAISIDPGFSNAKGQLAEASSLSEPVESIDELESAWNSALASEAGRAELLKATVDTLFQGDVERVPVPEPTPPEEVSVEILISW